MECGAWLRRSPEQWAEGAPATAGTGRFFQTVGHAPAADVPQSAATCTKGCSLGGLKFAWTIRHVLWAELLLMEGAACR